MHLIHCNYCRRWWWRWRTTTTELKVHGYIMVPISHVDYAFRPAWLPAYVQTEVYDNYIVPCAVLCCVQWQ